MQVDSNVETQGYKSLEGNKGGNEDIIDGVFKGGNTGLNAGENARGIAEGNARGNVGGKGGGNKGGNGVGPSVLYEERVAESMITIAGILKEQAMKLATLVGQLAEMT